MRRLLLILICTLMLSAAFQMPTLARQSDSSFEYTDCPFDVPQGETLGNSIDCGYFLVPEDYADPNSPEIYLAVAILYANTDSPAPDPVIYLAGGPGASAVLEVDSWVEDPIREPRHHPARPARHRLFRTLAVLPGRG
ncbi:MAG: hypothetical protein U0521_25480 [Anaerolineae bacterium]